MSEIDASETSLAEPREGGSPPAADRPRDVSRRAILRRGALLTAATAAASAGVVAASEACSTCQAALKSAPPPTPFVPIGTKLHPERVVCMNTDGAPPPVVPDPPDPMRFLTAFDYGKQSRTADGRTLREYVIVARNAEFEVSPGVFYPAWTFNGGIPGPTVRCTEGDLVRVHFFNQATKDHTIHFHGIHPAIMDGAFEIVPPNGYYRYEFEAKPFGCLAYHCHMAPLRKHFSKGMYGAFIIDPPTPRAEAIEMTMVMHGFDTLMTLAGNSFYGVNGPAFYYRDNPIVIPKGKLVRIYLVNMTEIDLLNSFHIHGNFFRLYRSGTRLDQYEYTDTVMLCQGERCVLEFSYEHTGDFLFHAHQNEFAERGWLGIFRVV